MKDKVTIVSLLAGCSLCLIFSPPASANHRAGTFALPELLLAGDFNQDGKLDLAVNVAGFDTIAILTGDGQGGFTLTEHLETDTLPKGLAAGDVDMDGHIDLVSIAQWGYSIRVNLGDGLGGFDYANELNGDGEPTRILLADLNRDGKLDLVANAPKEGKILLYFGDGKGGFSPSATELEDLPNDFGIASADFNRDGNPDIAATEIEDNSETGTHLVIFLGDGMGGFTRSAQFQINPSAVTLAVADADKDGKLDLIVAGAGPENETGLFVSTFLGDGTGNFILKQTVDLGAGSAGGLIGLGDFNEDGKLDVAFPVSTSQNMTKSTTVLILFGDGSGNLTLGPPLTVRKEPHSVIANDFNGDGHVDLAVTNRTDATVSIHLGNGDGTFVTHAVIPIAALPAP